MTTTSQVLYEVHVERERQEAKWGEQNHTPPYWLAILGEEYGEVCRAVCETMVPGNEGSTFDDYRAELVQVAAVAVAMVECLDRNR